MGFFSDLKEDLSQAVNELLPEDDVIRREDEDAQTADREAIEKIKNVPVVPEFTAPKPVAVPEFRAEPEEVHTETAKPEPAPVESAQPEGAESAFVPVSVQTPPVGSAADDAVISRHMLIQGNVTSQGNVMIDGQVQGNVEVQGRLILNGQVDGDVVAGELTMQQAKITGTVYGANLAQIGAGSVVKGNLTAGNAVVAGGIKGDLDIAGSVVLEGTAIVVGNIKCKSIQIHNGAVLEGMCSRCYADVNPMSFFEE